MGSERLMRVAILGAGALGSLLGGLLARVGTPVWLVSRQSAHVSAIEGGGLRIERAGAVPLLVRCRAVSDPVAAGPVDLVVVLVKAGDTAAAAAALHHLVGPETAVLTLQNGAGNAEQLAAAVGMERVLVGSTAQGATLLAPGCVRHAGSGPTHIGALHPAGRPAAAAAVALFRDAGLEAALSDDVAALVWSKLVINCAINALTALLGVPNGELLQQPAAELLAAAAREAAAVAGALGIQLPKGDPVERATAVARATAGNRSSMLQDMDRGRKTEVDAINGHVAREAERLGVAAPVNRTLWLLVKARERRKGGT